MDRHLNVGVPTYWGNLIPALQHTAYADALLVNQFESLVREGRGGTILPGLATEWSFNNDFTVFTFKIDTEKKFSDGQALAASDVKLAWEYGLDLQPRSSNSSLRDVLYLVHGFDEFERTKTLKGIKVVDKETIEIQFVKPFRTALSEFATGRMAIFRMVGGKPIGTGPYILEEESETELKLVENIFSSEPPGFNTVHVRIVEPQNARDALSAGLIEVYAFADRADVGACDGVSVSCITGMESGHLTISLNGLPRRIFSDPALRLAAQYLLHSKISKELLPNNYRTNLQIDAQPYLPLQAGRLPEEEVSQLLSAGREHVNALVSASHQTPLFLVTSEMNNWVQTLFETFGVKFTSNSGAIETKNRMEMFYKTFEPDIIVGGSSIASGDPDGLFHSLSKDGAIYSPMIYRKAVSDLLESGRSIIDQGSLDSHYRQVSVQFLKTVPYVHVGFVRGMHAFNPKKVSIVDSVKEREGNQFTLFKPR